MTKLVKNLIIGGSGTTVVAGTATGVGVGVAHKNKADDSNQSTIKQQAQVIAQNTKAATEAQTALAKTSNENELALIEAKIAAFDAERNAEFHQAQLTKIETLIRKYVAKQNAKAAQEALANTEAHVADFVSLKNAEYQAAVQAEVSAWVAQQNLNYKDAQIAVLKDRTALDHKKLVSQKTSEVQEAVEVTTKVNTEDKIDTALAALEARLNALSAEQAASQIDKQAQSKLAADQVRSAELESIDQEENAFTLDTLRTSLSDLVQGLMDSLHVPGAHLTTYAETSAKESFNSLVESISKATNVEELSTISSTALVSFRSLINELIDNQQRQLTIHLVHQTTEREFANHFSSSELEALRASEEAARAKEIAEYEKEQQAIADKNQIAIDAEEDSFMDGLALIAHIEKMRKQHEEKKAWSWSDNKFYQDTQDFIKRDDANKEAASRNQIMAELRAREVASMEEFKEIMMRLGQEKLDADNAQAAIDAEEDDFMNVVKGQELASENNKEGMAQHREAMLVLVRNAMRNDFYEKLVVPATEEDRLHPQYVKSLFLEFNEMLAKASSQEQLEQLAKDGDAGIAMVLQAQKTFDSYVASLASENNKEGMAQHKEAMLALVRNAMRNDFYENLVVPEKEEDRLHPQYVKTLFLEFNEMLAKASSQEELEQAAKDGEAMIAKALEEQKADADLLLRAQKLVDAIAQSETDAAAVEARLSADHARTIEQETDLINAATEAAIAKAQRAYDMEQIRLLEAKKAWVSKKDADKAAIQEMYTLAKDFKDLTDAEVSKMSETEFNAYIWWVLHSEQPDAFETQVNIENQGSSFVYTTNNGTVITFANVDELISAIITHNNSRQTPSYWLRTQHALELRQDALDTPRFLADLGKDMENANQIKAEQAAKANAEREAEIRKAGQAELDASQAILAANAKETNSQLFVMNRAAQERATKEHNKELEMVSLATDLNALRVIAEAQEKISERAQQLAMNTESFQLGHLYGPQLSQYHFYFEGIDNSESYKMSEENDKGQHAFLDQMVEEQQRLAEQEEYQEMLDKENQRVLDEFKAWKDEQSRINAQHVAQMKLDAQYYAWYKERMLAEAEWQAQDLAEAEYRFAKQQEADAAFTDALVNAQENAYMEQTAAANAIYQVKYEMASKNIENAQIELRTAQHDLANSGLSQGTSSYSYLVGKVQDAQAKLNAILNTIENL